MGNKGVNGRVERASVRRNNSLCILCARISRISPSRALIQTERRRKRLPPSARSITCSFLPSFLPNSLDSRHMGPERVCFQRPHGHEALRQAPGTRGRRSLRQAPPAAARHLRQRRRHRQDLERGGRRVVPEGAEGPRGEGLGRGCRQGQRTRRRRRRRRRRERKQRTANSSCGAGGSGFFFCKRQSAVFGLSFSFPKKPFHENNFF